MTDRTHPLYEQRRARTFPQRVERIAGDGTVESVQDDRTLEGERERVLGEVRRATAAALAATDWYLVRLAETGRAMPESVAEARDRVRRLSDEAQERVAAASSLEELDAVDPERAVGIEPEVPDYVRAARERGVL